MHIIDMIVIAGIALALFGPKTLQSIARNAGKGAAQANQLKNDLLSAVPVDSITKVTDDLPRIPLNSRQALSMLLTPEEKKSVETPSAPLQAQSPVQPAKKPVETL